MSINTNRIAARLAKSREALAVLKDAVKKALSTYTEADKAYLAIETAPPSPLPEGPTDEQTAEHQNSMEFYQDKLKRAATDAKAAFVALRNSEVANNPRIEALETVIEQQTAALERKAAVYPALLKAHLRRRANAGERIAKPAA